MKYSEYSRIVLVEPNKEMSSAIKKVLESKGYVVEVFNDGLEAEKYLLSPHSYYNLVILAISIPHKNGLEICSGIRKSKISVPILVLTDHNTIKDKIDAFDSGADDFLGKPFQFDELLARINALIRRSYGSFTKKFNIADINIDASAREVIRNGKHIPLTYTEFELLLHLIQHDGEVVSRKHIIEEMWGSDNSFQSNTIDVHVRNLRKKIDNKHTKKIIRTVRSIGYAIQK